MYRYDGEKFKLFTKRAGLAGNSTHCMFQDSKGRLWFGTDGGLSVLENVAETIFFNIGTTDGLQDINVRSISEDQKGNIWIGTDSVISLCPVILSLTELGREKFKTFLNSDGRPFENVWLVYRDLSGNMWISSSEGLCKFNVEKWTITSLKNQ